MDTETYVYCRWKRGGGGYGGGAGGGNYSGGGAGGSYVVDSATAVTYASADNGGGKPGGTPLGYGGDGSVTITYTVVQPVCLLENCDVLVEGDAKEHVYKNITKITKEDRVIGFFTRKPVKILEVIKRVHKIKNIEPTNLPYIIKKSSFGENTPDKNIHLSGHHRLIIRNGDGTFTGVQAFKLGLSKLEVDTETVTYFHIRLEITQEGLIVNNLPVESCQD